MNREYRYSGESDLKYKRRLEKEKKEYRRQAERKPGIFDRDPSKAQYLNEIKRADTKRYKK